MPRNQSNLRDAEETLNRLVDEYRSRCLWFLREDFYPVTLADRLKVLGYIERYGDREAFRKAANLKRWFSQNCSDASAGS